MRQCKHFIGTMRLHHLGSILSVLLRMTVFSASVLGPPSVNAADVRIDGAASPATASASEDQSPPKSDASTAVLSKSVSSSAQGPTRSEELEQVVVTGKRLKLNSGELGQDVHVYERQRMEESSQSTVRDFLQTLPEVSLNSVESSFLAPTVRLRGAIFRFTLHLNPAAP